jgi:hypothetical protein
MSHGSKQSDRGRGGATVSGFTISTELRHPPNHRLAKIQKRRSALLDEVADDGAAAPTIAGADKGFPQSIALWP